MREVGQVEHLHQVTPGLVGTLAVGLVDDEDVGDLHQAGLVRLHAVAPPGVDDDDGGVRLAGDLDLDLADADGLDEDPTAPDRIEGSDGFGGCEREPAEVAACRHRTNEHPGVGCMVLHPYPVAENRTAGERRRGIDRKDGDLQLERTEMLDDRRGERRLAGSGRPGEPDRVTGPGPRVRQSTDLAGLVVAALDERQQASESAAVAIEGGLEEFGGGQSFAGHRRRVGDQWHSPSGE